MPIDVKAATESRVNAHKEYARRIRETDLIIIDEISMLNRNVLKYLDKVLRDVCSTDEVFGGKVVVIGA